MISPVEMAGVLVSVVTASIATGVVQIFPGFSLCRLERVSQSPVPLGLSLSNQSVQHTAKSNTREDDWEETAEQKQPSK